MHPTFKPVLPQILKKLAALAMEGDGRIALGAIADVMPDLGLDPNEAAMLTDYLIDGGYVRQETSLMGALTAAGQRLADQA